MAGCRCVYLFTVYHEHPGWCVLSGDELEKGVTWQETGKLPALLSSLLLLLLGPCQNHLKADYPSPSRNWAWLCVQDGTGCSPESATPSLQHKIHPGDAKESLRTHPILLDSLRERLQRESALSSSSPRLHPGITLCCTQQNAAANK